MSLADRLVLGPDFGRRRLGTEALDSAILDIGKAFPGVQAHDPEDVEAVLSRLERAAARDDWSGVIIADVAIGLYEHFLGLRPLDPRLRDFLDTEARVTTRPQFLGAIAEAYLAGWAAGSAKTEAAKELVVARSQFLPTRWAHLFRSCPEFLDTGDGVTGIGQRMAHQSTPYDWLLSLGLPAPHGTGFMEGAHATFLRAVPDPRSKEVVDRLIGWTKPHDVPPLEDRRAAQVVDRIVSPWLSEACPETLRAYCSKRIVDAFGDPRWDRKEFWGQVRNETKRILFKWLARSSMDAIFEIVSEAERNNPGERQWRQRRQFWTRIYEEGRIDEAWVALGSDAVSIAARLYKQTQDKAYHYIDRQTTRRDTCLLFMKIGDKVFVEGSHNFRIHVFPTPTRKTPVFYAGPYDLNDILLPMPHDDARMHAGGWQDWVRRRLPR